MAPRNLTSRATTLLRLVIIQVDSKDVAIVYSGDSIVTSRHHIYFHTLI